MFLQYCIPKELITENGPESTSLHFKKFGILNTKQLVPIIINPAVWLNNQDEYLALLFLDSQHNQNWISPVQKLFNCQLRTTLPSVKPLLIQNSLVTESPRPVKRTILYEIFHKEKHGTINF